MNKAVFIERLEYLLSDIPEEEREEAIAYYQDYLDEAGEDREADVLSEFGSPERIASIIRSNLNADLEDGGSFTETGYEDERFRDPGYQVVKRKELPDVYEEAEAGFDGDAYEGFADRRRTTGFDEDMFEESTGNRTNRKSKNVRSGKNKNQTPVVKLILFGILALILLPWLLGVGSGVVAAAATLIALVAAAVLGIGFLTVAAGFSTVILTVMGAGILVSDFWGGITVAGFAVFVFGCALIGVALSILTYGKFVPWCIRTIVKILSGLLRGGKKLYEKLR